VNGIQIAKNIMAGLTRIDPGNAAYYAERFRDFQRRTLESVYGAELVGILTPDALFDMALQRTEWDFLQRNRYQGAPLAARLGGWMKDGTVLRDREMICYHREWVYFSARFAVPCAEFLEPKPGIPPSPRHVQRVIELMQARHIPVVFSPNYYDRRQVRQIAERTGATPVIVPGQTDGAPGVDTYAELIGTWVHELAAAFGQPRGTR
jgi:ABC-type Zn uptake system ZnuABC Zn-binding protein ZnuA